MIINSKIIIASVAILVASCSYHLPTGFISYGAQDELVKSIPVLYDVEYSEGHKSFCDYLQERYTKEWYSEGRDYGQRVLIKLYFRKNGKIDSIRMLEYKDLSLPQDLCDFIVTISHEAPGTWTVQDRKSNAYHCFIAVIKLY